MTATPPTANPHQPPVLWNHADLQAALGQVISIPHPQSLAIYRVITDSREARNGDLFVARRGDHLDGSHFVADALARGAALAITEKTASELALPADLHSRVVTVSDGDDALNQLAAYASQRSRATVVAITGSVGKTSSKTMIAEVLSHHGQTHASQGGFNNHVGVPLTLANLPIEADFAVVEIGMNHGGEIVPLSLLTRPHIAVITTVEAVHLENFTNIEGIAAAKAEIFAGLQPGGTAILNRDNRFYDFLLTQAEQAGAATIVSFGGDESATVRLWQESGKMTHLQIDGQPVAIRGDSSHSAGEAWLSVQRVTLAVLHALKLITPQSLSVMESMQPLAGRGQCITLPWPSGGQLSVIDDSYNASPVSVRAAISRLGQCQPGQNGRRILVLGDMRELGEQAVAMHRDLANDVLAHGLDLVFTSGALADNLLDALPHHLRGGNHPNPSDLASLLIPQLRAGDVITVKGSRGAAPKARMAAVVDAIKAFSASLANVAPPHFDRETA